MRAAISRRADVVYPPCRHGVLLPGRRGPGANRRSCCRPWCPHKRVDLGDRRLPRGQACPCAASGTARNCPPAAGSRAGVSFSAGIPKPRRFTPPTAGWRRPCCPRRGFRHRAPRSAQAATPLWPSGGRRAVETDGWRPDRHAGAGESPGRMGRGHPRHARGGAPAGAPIRPCLNSGGTLQPRRSRPMVDASSPRRNRLSLATNDRRDLTTCSTTPVLGIRGFLGAYVLPSVDLKIPCTRASPRPEQYLFSWCAVIVASWCRWRNYFQGSYSVRPEPFAGGRLLRGLRRQRPWPSVLGCVTTSTSGVLRARPT